MGLLPYVISDVTVFESVTTITANTMCDCGQRICILACLLALISVGLKLKVINDDQ